MGSLVGDAPRCPQEIQGPGKGQLWGSPGGQAACTGRGDRQRSPGDTGSRGGLALGLWGDRQHARGGDSRGVPEGPAAHTAGWLQSPMGSPGRDGNGVPGKQAACLGGIPRSHRVPGEGRPRGAGGGAGVVGRRAARLCQAGGMRPPRLSRGRGRPVCFPPGAAAAVVGVGKLQVCAWATARRRATRLPRPPTAPPRLTFKQDFFFPILASIWAKKEVRSPKPPNKAGLQGM